MIVGVMKTLLFLLAVGLLLYFGDAETRGIIVLFGILISIVIIFEHLTK